MASAVNAAASEAELTSPRCRVCGSSMVRRTARRGDNVGRAFWGCSRYSIDQCPGTIDIPPAVAALSGPGAFAQAEFERRRRRYRQKLAVLLPMLVALFCLLGISSFLAFAPYLGLWAGIPGVLVCLIGMAAVLHLPPEALYWDRGARGERRTAEALEGLLPHGFVVLYGREMPDDRGDIDAIAIGPTGVWVIETKSLSGDVAIANGRLFVRSQDRQAMVEQVYREAFAVQQIVGELLAPCHTMVTPVLCIHGARLPWLQYSVGGVRIASGGRLEHLISRLPEVLDEETVQKVAEATARKLREPWSWERAR
jgi:hypothetical protein